MPNHTNATEFIGYLEETLIPDLKESGREFTAEDFEDAIYWIREAHEAIRAYRKAVDAGINAAPALWANAANKGSTAIAR